MIFNGDRGERDDGEDVILGMPDISEVESNARHVERCALRYKMFSGRLRMHGKRLARIEMLIYGLFVYVVASSPVGASILKSIISGFGVAP